MTGLFAACGAADAATNKPCVYRAVRLVTARCDDGPHESTLPLCIYHLLSVDEAMCAACATHDDDPRDSPMQVTKSEVLE